MTAPEQPRRKSRWSGVIRLSRLPATRWALAVEAGFELVAMKILVQTFPPSKYSSLLRAVDSSGAADLSIERLHSDRLRELVWAIEAVGQYAPASFNCLPRALALQRMLMRRGAMGTICFGVRRVEHEVRAHAWLVLGGKILVGYLPDLDLYSEFSEWPGF